MRKTTELSELENSKILCFEMKFIILCSWLKFLIKVLHFNFLSIKKTKKKKLSIIKSPKNYFPLLKYLIKTNSFNRYHSPSILTVKRSIKLVVTLFSHSFKLVVTLLSHSPACQICNNIQHILNVFFFFTHNRNWTGIFPASTL